MTKTESYKAWIKDQMRKGIVNPEKVVALFCRKFQIKDRAFYNHWKVASEEYRIERLAIENKKVEVAAEEAVKAVRLDIMDKNERMVVLTKMARGIGRKVGEEIIMPTEGDRRAAIHIMNQMDGIYANREIDDSKISITINAEGMDLKADEI